MGIWLLVVGVLLALLIASMFVKRHAESEVPAGDWQRTDEVFRDPTSKRTMRVWVDPKDGSRHYVAEDGPPPSV